MISRFVVVPAVPTETGSVRSVRDGGRFYSSMASNGFDIYDNKKKCRLRLALPTRADAEAECEAKNSTQLFSSMS